MRASLALGVAWLTVACAGEPRGPGVPLAMHLTVPEHLGIVSLRLTVFDQNGTCEPDGDAAGNALPDLSDMPLPIGAPTEIKVSPGRRTFFVVGYDAGDDPVARGCAQETLSPNGQADVTITLSEYPSPPDAAPDAPSADAGPDAAPRPPGDACDDPLVVTPGVIVGGSSSNAIDDFAPTCGGSGLADLVYTFTLATDQRVRVTATVTAGAIDPVLSIRSACESVTSELGCADLGDGGSETLDIQELAAGTYFIVVDGGEGTFDLLVELLPVPPANDRCVGAGALVEGTPSLGTTVDASDDTTDTCGGGGVEVFYTFTLASERRVVVDLVEMGGSHSFSLRGTCGDATSELACSVGGTVDILALAAGTYTVVVEADGATGPFTLILNTFDPVPNDTCASPTTLGTPSTTLVDQSSVGAGDDEDGTCAGGGATPDIIYTYTLTEARHVNLSVTSDYDAAVSIRTPSCADEPSETACANSSTSAAGGTEVIDIRTQPAGTYYVVVDGVAGGEGLADVTLTTSPPPPPGDSCAELVTLPTGTSAAQSLSTGYADDASGTCGGAGGIDRVYTFAIVGSRHVNIVTQATFAHRIYVRSASCTAGTEQGCQAAVLSGGGTFDATLDFPNLAGGTYYVWVDGADATASGSFDVTLTVTTPVAPPANDTCAGATLLTEGLAIPGTLDAATNNVTTSCVSGTATDVFYRFTLATNRLVTLSLTSSIDSAITLYSGTCGTLAELSCENATTGGEVLVNENLPAGTYYVAVEGVAGATGAFNIGYTTSSPIIRPPNDACSGVIALTSGTTRTGDTMLNSLDHRDGTCGDTVSGDVVYSVTVPPGLNRRVRATVSNANGFDPVLYLQSGTCGTGPEVMCAQTSVGAGDVLDIASVAPGTYYLWVDSLGGEVSPATFDILVEVLTAVPPPSNDVCATPDALVAGTAENHSTVGAADDYALSCVTFDGRDTVHSFDTTALGARAVLITLDPSGWGAAMALRTAANCATTTDVSCVTEGWDTRYINRPNLPGGLYDIVVDGDMGAAGDYSIKYEVRPADTSFGYWSIDTTGTYAPVTGGTPVTIGLTNWGVDSGTGAGDEWTAPITLPFSFDYYGASYSSLNVSSNGFLTFGAAPPAGAENWTNDCPLGSSVPNNALAVFWDDGLTVTEYPSQLLTKVEGTAPNRRFIIEFKDFDVLSCNTMGNCYRMNVRMNQQVILYENGDIELRYGPRQMATLIDRNCSGGSGGATFDHAFGRCATLGIEGQVMATTDVDQIQCNTTTPSVNDGRVVYYVYPR